MTHAEISSSKVYSPEMTATVSHTPEGHLSATRQYNRILITTVHWPKKLQRTKEERQNFPEPNALLSNFFWTCKGREGRKKCFTVWQENKNWITWWVWKLIPKKVPRAQDPFSVKITCISYLCRKLSREEKHLFFFSVGTFYSLKLFKWSAYRDFLAMQFSFVPKVLF